MTAKKAILHAPISTLAIVEKYQCHGQLYRRSFKIPVMQVEGPIFTMSFFSCLLVIIGGAIGTLGRFLVGYAARPISHGFPWGTVLGINVVGSFIIGFFGTLTLAHGRFPVSENTRLFVMVGLCGGYTTFSSFSLQTLDLIRSGAWEKALANVVLSCALCVLAVAAGHGFASHLNGHAIEIAQLDIEEES